MPFIWDSFIEENGLPKDLEPETIRDYLIQFLNYCGYSKRIDELETGCDQLKEQLEATNERVRSADKRIAQRVSEYWGIPYDKIIEIVEEEFVSQPVRGRGCSACAGIIGNFTCCACGRVVKPDDTINERGFSTQLENHIRELERYKADHNVLLVRIKELRELRSRIIDARKKSE